MPDAQRYRAPAAACAADILRALADRPDQSVADLARAIESTRSLVYRVLGELSERTLVSETSQDGGTTVYRLGLGSMEIGASYVSSVPFFELARAALRNLARLTGETANLGTLRDSDALYLMREEGSRSVFSVSRVGRALPAHATGMGKAMLATLTDDELEATYAADVTLYAFTEHTITDRSQLLQDLSETRTRRYAVENQETVLGRCCVGIAVDASPIGGKVVGISVSTQSARFADEPETFLTPLLETRDALQRQLASRVVFGAADSPDTDRLLASIR